MFKTLGYETTVEEITQLITLVDADGNGALDFEEFVTLMDLFLQPSSSATD
jgi:Ca2+-binding EF-hand superfamily protein